MAKISAGPPASAKPSAVARKGAVQGVASKVAKAPVKKSPSSPRRLEALAKRPGEARQRDLEEAPEIGGEDRDQKGHGGEEQRLLELEAPADGKPCGFESGHQGRQHEEARQHARRRSPGN